MMQVFRVVSAAIVAAVFSAAPMAAQSLSQVAGPAEAPPAGYAGNQYVDSAGCVFIRAGVGGQTTWVPRVSRDRKLVCGYEPTFPAGMVAAVEALKEPAAPASAAPAAPAVDPAPAPEPAASEPQATDTPVPARTKAAPATSPSTRLVRAAPVAAAATLCLAPAPDSRRYLLSDGRRVTQCAGAAPDEPVAWLNGLGAPGLTVAPGAPSAAESRRALSADRGAYRVVWSNGEIAGAGVGAGAAAAPAGQGGYVQVGVFAEPANAAAAIARLKALGLPVASATGRKGGRAVKAIMAGPFASKAELEAALSAARQAGYPDAYPRG